MTFFSNTNLYITQQVEIFVSSNLTVLYYYYICIFMQNLKVYGGLIVEILRGGAKTSITVTFENRLYRIPTTKKTMRVSENKENESKETKEQRYYKGVQWSKGVE